MIITFIIKRSYGMVKEKLVNGKRENYGKIIANNSQMHETFEILLLYNIIVSH